MPVRRNAVARIVGITAQYLGDAPEGFVNVSGPPIPPPEEEMSDVYQTTFGSTVDTFAVPVMADEEIFNTLGGIMDINGVDPSFPFSYEVAEDGIYRLDVYLKTQSMDGFDNSGPNEVQWFFNLNGDFDLNYNFGASDVFHNYIPATSGNDSGSDARVVSRYFAAQAGQKVVPELFTEDEIVTGVAGQSYINSYTVLTYTKVADYTP